MIAMAKEDGAFIRMYDEKGHEIGYLTKKDGLVSFNSTTVSVRDGSFIRMYDEKGHETGYILA